MHLIHVCFHRGFACGADEGSLLLGRLVSFCHAHYGLGAVPGAAGIIPGPMLCFTKPAKPALCTLELSQQGHTKDSKHL